jgi:hypothetical protein
VKIRTAHVVAMTAVLPALGIAACGSASGPAAGSGPGTTTAATVKACDDILAFENSDADGTFNQEPASARALRDARHTPLENDLAAWIKAMTAASDYSDPAMLQAGRTSSRVRADCSQAGVQALPADPPGVVPAAASPAPGGMSSISVTSERDAWAAGCSGGTTILRHWDGTAWQPVSPPAGLVCGSAVASPVIVADSAAETWVFTSTGAASFASRWTGKTWTAPVRFTATSTIQTAVAAGAHDVWAFGVRLGSLYAVRYDGRTWASAPSPGVMADDASATSPGDLWVAGSTGPGLDFSASHWNGRAWDLVTPMRPPPGAQAVPDLVDAVAPDDVWAVTTIDPPDDNGPLRIGIAHWNGHTWQPVTYPYGALDGIDPLALAVAPDGTGGIWLAVQQHWLAHEHDGRWTLTSTPFMIQALARIPGTRTVWAAGSGGILKYGS